MEAAFMPATSLERSISALNEVTRRWFPGYSWHQNRYHSEGAHLTLTPDHRPGRKVKGIEEERLGPLIQAFEAVMGTSSYCGMKVERDYLRDANTPTATIIRPSADFLERNINIIEQAFLRRLQNTAGHYPWAERGPGY